MVLPGSKHYSGKFKRLAQLLGDEDGLSKVEGGLSDLCFRRTKQMDRCMHDPTTIACQLLRTD